MADLECTRHEPRMLFRDSDDLAESTRKENVRLKTVVAQLSAIVAKNVATQK
jgi:hypothetical protein